MAHAPIAGRDLLTIGQAAEILSVTEQTLRNWDRAGKLVARRHPINGYRLYHIVDLRKLLRSLDTQPEVQDRAQLAIDFDGGNEATESGRHTGMNADLGSLPACHWSLSVALDPKHRPQDWGKPASTVRRDWRKYPQEAHVLDLRRERYRRLTVEEIALLQGFDPAIARGTGLTDRQLIAGLGDAVPPPLANALCRAIAETWKPENRTVIEICAGIGGLAEGAAAIGLKHAALIEKSRDCAPLLANQRPWHSSVITIDDVRSHDFSSYGQIGMLSGGPPCQPWSASGHHRGVADERDLLGHLPDLVGRLSPEVFLFENVPGLLSESNADYLNDLVRRLRRTPAGPRYGVMVGLFNAADFGVPQVRRRLFILGFRDNPSSTASKCFDLVETMRTNRDPKVPFAGRQPWVAVGEVLSERPDPGGWRRWIGVTGH